VDKEADDARDKGREEDDAEDDRTGNPEAAGFRRFGGSGGSSRNEGVRLSHISPF
jgi:hypothetical protein